MTGNHEQLISLFLQSPLTMTERQREELSAWIAQDIRNTREFIKASLFHRSIHNVLIDSDVERKRILQGDMKCPEAGSESFDQQLWERLLQQEETAPEIEIPHQKPQIEIIQKVQRQKIVRNISKSSLITLCTAAAAIVFVFVFAHFAPTARGFKVAVLSDCIHARWRDMDTAPQKGEPFFAGNKTYLLQDGYAKILFDSQVQVTLEGPAEFGILSEDRINIQSGRLYAVVGPQAIGFMVTSQNAKIIDLGTEFGVEVNTRGDTCLHVIKGKTTLIAGEKSNKISVDVTGGIAKKVSTESQTVSDITCDERLFARDIDSAKDIIWHGQPTRSSSKHLSWLGKSGNWSDEANWDAGYKPDGTQVIRLQSQEPSVCTLNTAEKPLSSQISVSNGQVLNIEDGGYIGCGWSRFGTSTVNMSGSGTWVLNQDDLYIGYPLDKNSVCVWTMSDTSRITVNDRGNLFISQDNAAGTLRLTGSGVSVECDELYVGYARNTGYTPQATIEFVMDAAGVSTIRVGYRLHLSQGAAASHLVVSVKESLPKKDLVLIETKSSEMIEGDGVFDTLNGGPAAEGTSLSLGGNQYGLTYQYDANGDGCRNDVALVFKESRPQQSIIDD